MAFPQAEEGGRRSCRAVGVAALGLFLTVSAASALAEGAATVVSPPHPPAAAPGAVPIEGVDLSLSPECRVPGSKLYTLARLAAVKHALKEKRPVRVLSVGSSSSGLGASASYPVRLENALERSLPNVDVQIDSRGLSGEVASGAGERLRTMVAEVEPDLVVWQVGTNDALARVDADAFADALKDTVEWIKSHHIDVVLIDPLFTQSVAEDESYNGLVHKVQDVAVAQGVPLVRRYEAMRFLSASADKGSETHMLGRHFRLNDLGLRCMAEHVTRAITLSLLQPDLAVAPAAEPQAKTTEPEKPSGH
ncbi:SGNH/GDSL hydrolase family protein [Methylobacterium sp. C25]|uniref:SGNH/GDSL hydrolase family protein n=1 Tax=Methylobacterium sp. C25 TaxID=2721622 RepID=UPI001F21E525|nr:SGNH/GDSL hydrolase family protein [Methylobacterium sp. C25]MCE4225549.1 SGNH/GDSL hydrolase family protein [Methylobacterium sp. C25]